MRCNCKLITHTYNRPIRPPEDHIRHAACHSTPPMANSTCLIPPTTAIAQGACQHCHRQLRPTQLSETHQQTKPQEKQPWYACGRGKPVRFAGMKLTQPAHECYNTCTIAGTSQAARGSVMPTQVPTKGTQTCCCCCNMRCSSYLNSHSSAAVQKLGPWALTSRPPSALQGWSWGECWPLHRLQGCGTWL